MGIPWFFYLFQEGGDKMKRVLLKYVLKYRALVIVPTIAMIAGIGLDMLNPYYMSVMIDSVIVKGKVNILSKVLIALSIIAIARAIFGYIKEYLFDVLSADINIDLKRDLFNHIQSLPYSYFDNMNTGELMSRIGEDVDNIWRNISFGTRLFIENGIYFVVASAILFYLNWKLAIISLLVMPFISYTALRLEKKIDKTYEKISDQAAVINTTAEENIAGVRLVKAFAREKYEIMKFLRLNNENYKLNMEQSEIISKHFPLMELLSNISTVLVVSIGGIFVIKQSLTIGTLVAFNGYIWMLIWPMRQLGFLTNILAQSDASAKKIFKIMDTKPDIKDDVNAIHPETIHGDVKFENVSFKYKDDYILKNLNIDVKAGDTIAIMGTTGSGKTSIINLIGRFYDIASGKITIDGMDIKKIALKNLRSAISYVSQDTFLFSETVEENVRMGRFDASFDEIKSACSDACADEFISELKDGYNAIIGERGIGLSGGQKQRISIARALLKNSGILVLDDATSALDMETEYQLLKNLHSRDKKVTTFIIAHRISAVKNADEIIYLENGEIVERGTHEELLNLKGRYYEIYSEQFKDFDDAASEVI
jgi:ATP-binding cassette subfamily B multidrug efflux pump